MSAPALVTSTNQALMAEAAVVPSLNGDWAGRSSASDDDRSAALGSTARPATRCLAAMLVMLLANSVVRPSVNGPATAIFSGPPSAGSATASRSAAAPSNTGGACGVVVTGDPASWATIWPISSRGVGPMLVSSRLASCSHCSS